MFNFLPLTYGNKINIVWGVGLIKFHFDLTLNNFPGMRLPFGN